VTAESIMLDLARRAPSLQGVAHGWLDQEQANPPAQVRAQVASAPATTAYAVFAIVLAGLLVGTAIVATAGSTRPGWTWIQDLASVCFLGALAGSVVFLLGALRRLRGNPDDDSKRG